MNLRSVTKLAESYYRIYTRKFAMEQLIFFVTNRCNFRCKHCFSMSDLEKDKRPELSLEEISKFSRSIGNLKVLLLSGGEPVVRKDLPEICQVFYEQNHIQQIHLPTNAFYQKKVIDTVLSISDKCPGVRLDIGIHLDGLQETHDKIVGLEGSFVKAEQTINALAPLKAENPNLRVYVITTVNKLNLGEIGELNDYVKSLPIDNFGPSPMRGAPYDTELSPPHAAEWAQLADNDKRSRDFWNQRNGEGGIKKFFRLNRFKYMCDVYEMVLRENRLPFTCKAGKIISVLYPSGDFGGCELKDIWGNIRDFDYDIKPLWYSTMADQFREELKGCACAHSCFLQPSVQLNPISLTKSYLTGHA